MFYFHSDDSTKEGAVMDSQDEFDHGVYPKDPNVMGYWKKLRLVFVIFFLSGVLGMLMCNALEVL